MRIEHISPSSVILFCNDYDKWYKNYILKEKEPDNIYFQAGTACHNFLEDFYKEGPSQGDTISTFTTRKFSELFTYHISQNEQLKSFYTEDINEDTLKEWLTEYIRVWVKESKKLEAKYGTEKAFKYNSPIVMEEEVINDLYKVKCRIDAIYTEDRFNKPSKTLRIVIADYKTSTKTTNTLPVDYNIQLMMYALLKNKKSTKVDWVCVDYLKYNQKYFFRVTDESLKKITLLLSEIWSHIKIIEGLLDEGKDEEAQKYNSGIRLQDFV